ncbi:hypothetical protein V1478_001264 [Vespula squamosa]|uniref:Uncharacterized protein n=1 Tax=Vespula squamosa TaxID=30214 RepID=A0ABD2C0Z6_VESSQ
MDVLIASWIPRYQFLDITRCSSKEEIFSVVISFHFFDTVKVKNSLRKIVTHVSIEHRLCVILSVSAQPRA